MVRAAHLWVQMVAVMNQSISNIISPTESPNQLLLMLKRTQSRRETQLDIYDALTYWNDATLTATGI